jgi:hypothetical protein
LNFLKFLHFIQFRAGYNRLVERLVVGLVELAISIYRGTVVRLTAVGDSILSLGRRIAHRLRRQPSTGAQVFVF